MELYIIDGVHWEKFIHPLLSIQNSVCRGVRCLTLPFLITLKLRLAGACTQMVVGNTQTIRTFGHESFSTWGERGLSTQGSMDVGSD